MKLKWGILYNNTDKSLVKEFRGCFNGKFWCSIVLLFYLEAIYLPVLKSLVHMYEMCQMNRLWLTQIYLYRWYIPDLIRLANDIETNPGPVVVDNIDSCKTICAPYSQPSAVFNYEQNVRKSTRNHYANKKPAVDPAKTIAAPYSQGNVEIFGTNAGHAGTQCVAMSLSALVFNFRNSITSSADLVQIMNIGNNMYSALSQSAKQGLLLLTDLPCMVHLRDTNYQLTYSESYSGLINSFALPIIADFPYFASLSGVLNCLVMDNYHAFILTVDIYTAAIYCLPNGGYKVFDSHSRDLFGMAHPYGTCTLVEIDSLGNLVQYFQNIYAESNTYEIKGVNIIEMQTTMETPLIPYVLKMMILDLVSTYLEMKFIFVLAKNVVL